VEEEAENGAIDDGNHYVAVGFSDDSAMGKDTAIAAADTFVSLHYNYISPDEEDRYAIEVGDNTAIRNTQVTSADGALYASFTIPVTFSYVAPTPEGPVEVSNDLAEGKFVLASAGPLNDGGVGYHSVRAFTEAAATP